MLNFMSHGTQDLYPTFLQQPAPFRPAHNGDHQRDLDARCDCGRNCWSGFTPIAAAGGARWSRRRLVAILVDPAVGFRAACVALIAAGAFLMQFMVQGAWGVIPAHINELSPGPAARILPRLRLPVGVLIAASAPYIEAVMSHRMGYGQAMGAFAAIAFAFGAIVIALGPEAHRVSFVRRKNSSVTW